MKTIQREILRIAVPAIVSNVTVPLLGLVDSAITGHLGSAAYIGAVAVGAMLFNLIYWLLGFLRMGTSGMTSQAYGAGQAEQVQRLLYQSMGIGLLLGVTLLALWWPLREGGLWLMGPSDEVALHARTYINICIWGAPAMLPLTALNGWFLGMQDSRSPMIMSIVQNVVNILASLLFVFGLGMKVEGVALGTLVAQWTGLGVGMLCLRSFNDDNSRRYLGSFRAFRPFRSFRSMGGLEGFFRVNRDIFVRTLFLVAVMFFFTSAGARQGDTVLAVNSLLMHFSLLFSFVMDGFAFAAEAMCGRFYGAGRYVAFRATVRGVMGWGAVLVLLFSAVYAIGGQDLLCLLTDEASVVEASADYLPWAVLLPVTGVLAFVWDGVFIGTTSTRQMLVSSVVSTLLFFALFMLLTSVSGLFPTEKANHALWLAYLCYLLSRGVIQTIYYGRLFVPERFRRSSSDAR